MKRVLSQQEIDSLFSGGGASRPDSAATVVPFDFSRLDRIPKSQIRVVHSLFEAFIRNVATSMAGYLRTYVSPTLVSLEQISYGEFLEGLETPTCLGYVGLRPFDGTMLVGLSRTLVFAGVELLLGGDPEVVETPARKLTDIEKNLVQNLLRIFLADFREAWSNVADIEFDVQSLADDQHGLRVMTAAEAVVAVSVEMKVGKTTTMVNMAIPSIFIKRLRDRFERLHSVQRASSKPEDQVHMARLVHQINVDLEVRLDGGTVSAQDLQDLEVGDVLMLAHSVDTPVSAFLNDRPMFLGSIGAPGERVQYTVLRRSDAL